MTNPYLQSVEQHSGKDLPSGTEQTLGKPRAASFQDEHTRFLATVVKLIDAGKIDTKNPGSFIKADVYAGLSADWQKRVDLTTPNIITLLEHIMDLHLRPEKDESFEMKNLIETLWQAKQRIEEHVDVFIF